MNIHRAPGYQELSPATAQVLGHLVGLLVAADGIVRVDRGTIAGALGRSLRTVTRALGELHALELIEYRQGQHFENNGQGPNLYWIGAALAPLARRFASENLSPPIPRRGKENFEVREEPQESAGGRRGGTPDQVRRRIPAHFTRAGRRTMDAPEHDPGRLLDALVLAVGDSRVSDTCRRTLTKLAKAAPLGWWKTAIHVARDVGRSPGIKIPGAYISQEVVRTMAAAGEDVPECLHRWLAPKKKRRRRSAPSSSSSEAWRPPDSASTQAPPPEPARSGPILVRDVEEARQLSAQLRREWQDLDTPQRRKKP